MKTKEKSIYIASDHAGLEIKKRFIAHLSSQRAFRVLDLGTHTGDRVDYPDFADRVCRKVIGEKGSLGVLICGSGQGMAMRANKYSSIRAALCWSEESARLAREHNQANILCLGARLLDEDSLLKISKVFLNTEFGGGHHQMRVQKISKPTET